VRQTKKKVIGQMKLDEKGLSLSYSRSRTM